MGTDSTSSRHTPLGNPNRSRLCAIAPTRCPVLSARVEGVPVVVVAVVVVDVVGAMVVVAMGVAVWLVVVVDDLAVPRDLSVNQARRGLVISDGAILIFRGERFLH